MAEVVYVLTNQAMPGLVKIGRTEGDVRQRMRSLDTTGIPLPFECFAAWEVANAGRAEDALHVAFGDHRIRDRREFFRISPDKPTAILRAFGKKDVTPTEDIVEDADDARALEKARARRPSFAFSMVGISPGAPLHSLFDDGITCVVVDEKNVEFRGEVMSLSKSALIIAHEQGRRWKAVAGTEFWKFEDETLANLRFDAEDGDD